MVSNKREQQTAQSSGFTKEELLLLEDFSKKVSTKSSALFYGNAFIVSTIPLWLFWRIHNMDIVSSLSLFVLVITALSTYFIATAYKNIKYHLKHKISVSRENAITREVNRQLNDDKKTTRKEKEEKILWKKNEVADYEATTFSIFYNNALFLSLIVLVSFFILRNSSPIINYIVSISLASGSLALFSTSAQVK